MQNFSSVIIEKVGSITLFLKLTEYYGDVL